MSDDRYLFLPGYGARAATYEQGLPPGWTALQPPAWTARAPLHSLRDWLVTDLRGRQRPVVLAGHSMGAALAMLAAVRAPEHVAGLVLVAPAGLPLTKPVRDCIRDGLRQTIGGRHRVRDVLVSLADLARAPRASVRLARALRRLDLTRTMRSLQAAGIPALVIGCTTDTLVSPTHTRSIAHLLGADYRELASAGGHVWMFGDWVRLQRELARVA